MFTSQEEVQFWALRLKFARSWFKSRTFVINDGLCAIARLNYTQLLVAEFTYLFNHRQKKENYHG